jgi:hypothetical protein
MFELFYLPLTLRCVTYKLDSIQKHQKSKGHEKSLLIEKAKNESKAELKASKIIQTLNTENLFRGLQYIVLMKLSGNS